MRKLFVTITSTSKETPIAPDDHRRGNRR